MNVFIFPGQGCQKEGMGKELYQHFPIAQEIFNKADIALGRSITDVMFNGSELELLETKNTQPAVFLYEVALALTQKEIQPEAVAGHSLGEFAALVVAGVLSFEEGLNLVLNRALIGQKVCEKFETAMGAIIGLPEEYVQNKIAELSSESGEPVYLANYNGPGQVVITGSRNGVKLVLKTLRSEGAKKAVLLPISGSFHSPYMEEARIELGRIIEETEFRAPSIPIYQCVDALPHTDPVEIKTNLVQHITSSVLWTQMVDNMVSDGASSFHEIGPDDTLTKIVSRMYPEISCNSILDIAEYKGILTDYRIIN